MEWDLEKEGGPKTQEVQQTQAGVPVTIDQAKRAIEKGRADLQVYAEKIKDMKVEAQLLKVESEETLGLSVDLGIRAKKLSKEINETANRMLSPAGEFIKAVKNFSKEFTNTLDEIEGITKSKNKTFKTLQEQRELEAQRKREEETKRIQELVDKEAKDAGIEPLKVETPPPMKTARVVRTASGTAYSSEYWKFEAGPIHRNSLNYERKKRIQVYIGSQKEKMLEKGFAAGLAGEPLETFKFALNEVKFELEVDEEGNATIVSVDDKLVPIIPAEYLEPDNKALRKAVDGGLRNIEGVKIWREDKEVYK